MYKLFKVYMFSWLQTIVEVCDGKANVGNMSVDGVKLVSFNIRENIAQAIKPTTVELKLNTTLQVVLLAVATFLLRDVINISTRFVHTPTHISNPFLRSIIHGYTQQLV